MHLFDKMATRGGTMGVSSFPSTPSCFCKKSRAQNSIISLTVRKPVTTTRIVACSAVQESSTSTVAADAKEVKKVEKKAATAKAKPAAKAPAKPLPEMMEEDVIPSLKAILEAQDDISQLELSFQDNRLQGSFLKRGKPYSFWAFFPSGALTGPRGFSLSSYGSGASTVEPFLVDEKKITHKHIVFWVEKRLAAQGIIRGVVQLHTMICRPNSAFKSHEQQLSKIQLS